jgi:transposase
MAVAEVRTATKTTKNGDKHMKSINKYVGLDVHKDTITVAVAEGGREGEVRPYGRIANDLTALEKVLRKLGGEGVALHVVYEAGPTGFVVYRRLGQLEIDCIVVAPSRIPQPNGPRQKTDRRDAVQLARLHRAGELTAIHVPDAVDESIRDLTRARADAVHDRTRAKQRLKAFLLRLGYRYSGSANWSEAHQRFLRKLTLPLPALRSVLEEQLLAMDQAVQRVARLDELIAVQVPQWRHYPSVQAVIVAELGDVRRFAHPRHLMAFLGLVPKESTTGETRRLGAITKAGNAQARWCLIEAIQKALTPPKVSARLSLRQHGQAARYRELAWKTQVRLHKRGWHLLHRGVMKAKVNVALARELSGFLWDLLRQVPEPPL